MKYFAVFADVKLINRHSPHGECGLKLHLRSYLPPSIRSLPAWGVWIEICGAYIDRLHLCRHSPHGECGLKFEVIEFQNPLVYSHSPHGECGLKSHNGQIQHNCQRHSPHGECGLKLVRVFVTLTLALSLPAWGVWIEIITGGSFTASRNSSLPAWGVWIEILCKA